MTIQVSFVPSDNVATLGGESLVFHCHFYNCALQAAIESGLGADAKQLLQQAAEDPAFRQISALVADQPNQAHTVASQVFRQLGFGDLDLSQIGEPGGTVLLQASHYAMGWVAAMGPSKVPVCHFPAGFIAGALRVAWQRPRGGIKVQETACYAAGASGCKFDVEVK